MVSRLAICVLVLLMTAADASEQRGAAVNLEGELGRLLMVAFRGEEPPPDIAQQLRPGGYIFFAGNVPSVAEARKTVRRLQQASEAPLLFAIDQEGGPFSSFRPDGATLFPGNMALGAADDVELTRQVAEALGRELAYVGFNMNFAPVVDVGTNPDNPIIGIRSFGADPELVARHGQAFRSGLEAANVASVAKHFPGHGDTSVDSHLALPSVDGDRERLEKVELPPFQALIEAGVPAIMTAHVAFPAFEPGVPATLSRAVLTGLLRQELGFDGLVITDYMDMRAIADHYGPGEAAVKSVAAGADMVLLGPDAEVQREVVAELEAALADGRLTKERVAEALGRIAAVAEAYPVHEAPEPDWFAHRTLALSAAQAGATQLWDDGVLPLPVGARVLVVAPRPAAFGAPPHLGDVLAGYHDTVNVSNVGERPTPEEIDASVALAREADVIVLGSYYWLGGYPAELAALADRLGALGRPLILVSMGNPDDLRHLGVRPEAYLAVYGYREANLEAAARVLVGKHAAQGRLPVYAGDFPPGSGGDAR